MLASTRLRAAVICLVVLPVLAACSSSGSTDAGNSGADASGKGASTPGGATPTGSATGTGSDAGGTTGPTGTTGTTGTGGATAGSGSGSSATKGGGTIRYSGPENGTVTFDSANCATFGGKFTALLAPDDEVQENSTAHLGVLITDGTAQVTFQVSDGMAYVKIGADGVTTAKKDGVWVVALAGTQAGSTDVDTGSITLNGTVTCGRTDGT